MVKRRLCPPSVEQRGAGKALKGKHLLMVTRRASGSREISAGFPRRMALELRKVQKIMGL